MEINKHIPLTMYFEMSKQINKQLDLIFSRANLTLFVNFTASTFDLALKLLHFKISTIAAHDGNVSEGGASPLNDTTA